MIGSLISKKKCFLCGAEVKNSVSRTVPVRSYTVDQKRNFCCEEHADHYEKTIGKIVAQEPKACRTCFSASAARTLCALAHR